jgi:branched-chain amino acid transport system permease protein
MSPPNYLRKLDQYWQAGTREKVQAALPIVLVGLAIPLFTETFLTDVFTSMLILVISALGFNFAFGFADVVSFGHNVFFAIGGYGFAVLLTNDVTGGFLVPFIFAVLLVLAFGAIIGGISMRGTGIYFTLLTFAFGIIVFQGLQSADFVGGSDGLIIPPVTLPLGLAPDPNTVYYLSFVLFLGTLVSQYHILRSPFGRVMRAIRANDDRAEYIGYPVNRVKIVVFVLSAFYTGLGGVMLAMRNQFISPSAASLEIAIDMIIVTIVGGSSFLIGPVVGGIFLVSVEHLTRDLENVATIILGVVLILVILFMPEGIYGKGVAVWREKIRK